MTAIIPHSVTQSNPSYAVQRQYLKEYTISSESAVKVAFDPIKGAFGVLQEEGKTITFPFDRFVGIPKEIKFNQAKLVSFLEDSYITLRRSDDNQFSIVVNPRLRGGGNKHSSHSNSYHYTSPPPLPITTVTYSAGFTIRSLFLEPQLGGEYYEAAGAAGGTAFTVKFISGAGALPLVKIHVWKQDYYAQRIVQLQQLKQTHSQHIANELAKKQAAEAVKANINAMLQSLQNHRAEQQSNEQVSQQLKNEIEAVKVQVDGLKPALKENYDAITKEGPNIRTMVELINAINGAGIAIFKPEHLAIHQFAAKYSLGHSWIGTTSSTDGLLGKTLIELNRVIAEAQKSKGKDIVALVGNTGTGKSTAVNYLLGIPMKFVPANRGGTIQVADGQQEMAKIGHHIATSETLYTQVYEKNGVPFVFADCGGFFDTRGTSQDIAVVTSLKMALENSKSAKLVLCFDSVLLDRERGRLFFESMKLSLKTLMKDYKAHGNSIVLMFTKPTKDLNGVLFNAKEAFQILSEFMNDLPDGSEQKEIYKFLTREQGQYICVCDPLSEEGRGQLHQILDKMTPITTTKDAFQAGCGASTQVELLEEMTKLAVKTVGWINAYAALNTQDVELRNKVKGLEAKLAENVKQRGLIDAAMKVPETFLQSNTLAANAATIQTIDQNIAAEQGAIASFDAELAKKNNTQILVYTSRGNGWTVTDHTTGAAL